MSIVRKIKQYLPGSGRSMHAMHDEMNRRFDELYRRIEQADAGINGNIDFKFDELALPKINGIANDLDAHDAHMKMFAWEQYRCEGETLDDAKKRFFTSLPKATGASRLLQVGCAKLLQEFDELCSANDLRYFATCGTLLGAVRHGGFIPWDDDVDLGMMREDIDVLSGIVEGNSRYRMTLVYDWYAKCRQVRFWYADENLPCFLDIFIYDWCSSDLSSAYAQQIDIRNSMTAEMDAEPELAFWEEEPYLSSNDERALLVERYFQKALEIEREAGLVVSQQDAKGVIWSIDNICSNQSLCLLSPLAEVFPLRSLDFEAAHVAAPSRSLDMLGRFYGDPFALPKDIHTHYKHADVDGDAQARALSDLGEE